MSSAERCNQKAAMTAILLCVWSYISQPIGAVRSCENNQDFNSTELRCDCNMDPEEGLTYRGSRCQVPSQECGGAVWCVNGGTCNLQYHTDVFACQCLKGFGGAHCEQNNTTSTCSDETVCENGGSCQKLQHVDAFICRCLDGYVGNDCSLSIAALDADVCGPRLYCLNGGRCDDAGTTCNCAEGFSGKACDTTKEVTKASVAGPKPSTDKLQGTPKTASERVAESQRQSNDDEGLSGGAIAGLCIGVAAGVAALALAAALVWRRRRSTAQRDKDGTDAQKFVAESGINSSQNVPDP